MNNKKHDSQSSINSGDILQICPKVGNKKFEEPPLEKEILAFLASLGHSGEKEKNIRKIHQNMMSMSISCINPGDHLLLSSTNVSVVKHPKTVFVFLKLKSYGECTITRRLIMHIFYGRTSFIRLRTRIRRRAMQSELTNEDIRNSESYKEYYAIASGKIHSQPKASKKQADYMQPLSRSPPIDPPKEKKGKKTGKGKQKAKELETISEAVLTEAEQLKIITKRSRKETHSSHASGSGADEGTGVSPGVPDAPDYDSDDDISWKSSEDDQDEDKNEDDENVQDDDDDAKSGDDELKSQDDDDEAQTESEDDVHTPSHVSSSDDEDSDNEVEGVDVEGEKSDEDATYVEDQGNEADRDTNANLEGRDDVMTDVVVPQVQVTQEIEDTHVTLTPVNPDGQQQSSSISSGFEAKTSHGVAANLSELELKKILIDKMEANKSINRFLTIQKATLQVILSGCVYEADKILLDTYGDTVTIKRPRDGADDDQEPSAGTDRGSKRRRSGKNAKSPIMLQEKTTTTAGKTTTGSKTHKQSASQSAPVEETMQSTDVFEAPAHQEFETGVHDEQTEEEVHPLPDWFQQPKRLPSPDHAWNKSVPAVHESVQPWLSNLARRQDPRESFDELTDTTFDFSAFVMNRLNVTTLTPELLAGPTFELMKGTCKSLTELEYFCEEVYKATTEKLDWINPEGRQYPHDLRKPLPLVPNSQGRHVIPFHHFINNDLEYLRGGESSRKYSTSVTKTKAADYGHIKWIEDLVPNSMWSQGIIAVTKVEIVEWQNYKHLDWITVRRDDDILYKFKEGDFHRLRIQDIEDMLLLLVQGKLTNLNVEERLAFNVSLRMFTRSVVIQRRVEDLQLGVESYQKKLNLTKPDTYRSNLRRRDAYTPYSDPRGFIYENKDKKNRLMRIDEGEAKTTSTQTSPTTQA
ncbi:hypothetical protein Tco_1195191 [Tanacetum coccineum]